MRGVPEAMCREDLAHAEKGRCEPICDAISFGNIKRLGTLEEGTNWFLKQMS